MYTFLQPKSAMMENLLSWGKFQTLKWIADSSINWNPHFLLFLGGYCRIGVLVDLFYEHREALLAENITKEEIIETFFQINTIYKTHLKITEKDYSALSRRMNFDDFLEYAMRLMNSVYWTNGMISSSSAEGEEGGMSKEASIAMQDSTSTQSTGDIHAMELQKKMEKLLEVINK